MNDGKILSKLENELGPIVEKEEICLGVYLLSAKNDDELLSRDYYAVMENSLIPQGAKTYGRKLFGLWLFPMTDGSKVLCCVREESGNCRPAIDTRRGEGYYQSVGNI